MPPAARRSPAGQPTPRLARRGALAALLGLALLLPLAPLLVRQAAFTLQADALTARLDHRRPIGAIDWRASHGPEGAPTTVAAVLLETALESGGAQGISADARRRLDLLTASGSELIADWSAGRERVRFEIRATPIPVALIDDGHGGRWPSPLEVVTIAEALFPDLQPDAVLLLWGDERFDVAGAAGLTTRVLAFGGVRPYMAIPDPGVRIERHAYPGEILVHEFGHALEITSEQLGEQRVSLHHPERYGFTEQGAMLNWYRFFFAHPTERLAEAAGRAPPATPVATRRPFGEIVPVFRWHP